MVFVGGCTCSIAVESCVQWWQPYATHPWPWMLFIVQAQAIRQGEVEFYIWANASYFPFAQVVTDMWVSQLVLVGLLNCAARS